MKKTLCILLTIAMIACLCACSNRTTEETSDISVYVLAGPSGVGAVDLWNKSETGNTKNNYKFTCVSTNDEIVAAISNGTADIAAVATNLASSLYNKTSGNVKVLAVSTLGVLSIMTNGTEINSVADLKGKTIYSIGQGANPQYILEYILKGNGIDPTKDVNINFLTEGNELLQVWAQTPDAVIMAPQPVATTLAMKNTTAKTVLNMTEEWNKISTGSELMMGCVIVRKAFLDEHPGAVKTFLKEYSQSINAVKNDAIAAGVLCEKYKIIPGAALATKAIPGCSLTYVDGSVMKTELSGYLDVMFKANPKSIGGTLPADDFYYEG